MSEITLKIEIGAMIKNLKFKSFQHLNEVRIFCKGEMAALDSSKSWEDHKLFWTEKQIWPDPHHSLDYYDIHTGTELQFRKCHAPLKVHLPDGSLKVILVDQSMSVRGVLAEIARSIDLETDLELGLAVDHIPEASKCKSASKFINLSLVPEDKESILKVYSKFKSKSSICTKKDTCLPLNLTYLDESQCLAQQNVTMDTQFILKFRYFNNMLVAPHELMRIRFLFFQAVTMYLSSFCLPTEDDMLEMASLLCQIEWGDINEDEHVPGFINAHKHLLVPKKHFKKPMKKRIISAYKELQGTEEVAAMMCFIQIWSSLSMFGMEIVSGSDKETKKKALLGISCKRIFYLTSSMKEPEIFDISFMQKMYHDRNNYITFSFLTLGKQKSISMKCDMPVFSVIERVTGNIALITYQKESHQVSDDIDVFIKRVTNSLSFSDVSMATLRRCSSKSLNVSVNGIKKDNSEVLA